MQTVKHLFVPATQHLPRVVGEVSQVLVDNDTRFGVEIELEGCKDKALTDGAHLHAVSGYDLPDGVEAHKDGSLRNGGIEFVTLPLNGQDLVDAITETCSVAKEIGLNTSNRAGVHIHMDMQETTLEQYINFLMLYTLIEPCVFKAAANHRGGSIYCKSWYEGSANDELRNFIQGIMSGGWGHLSSRYLGLNLKSTAKYGTLEFRHLQSTMDADQIIEWINVLAKMRAYATTKPIFKAEDVPALSYEVLLRDVFGLGYYKYMPEDFASYFYQTCIPLWFDLFGPQSDKLTWERNREMLKPHSGYMAFMSRNKKPEKPKPKKPRKWAASIHTYGTEIPPEFIINMGAAGPATPVPEAPPPNGYFNGDYRVYFSVPEYREDKVVPGGPYAHHSAEGRVWVHTIDNRRDIQTTMSRQTERNRGAGTIVYRYTRYSD